MDLSTPEPNRKKKKKPLSAEVRETMTSSPKDRWVGRHAIRDRKIIELYKAGNISTVGVAEKVECSQATVIKVLGRAAKEGLVTIRKRGQTLAKGAK